MTREADSSTVNAIPPFEVKRRGLMLILSSPSGAGKTSIARALLARDSDIVMSVSATTRTARPGEVEGRDYLFLDRAQFDAMVLRNEFLEHARVFDNDYGTPRAAVEATIAMGKDVLFDIDWQGTQQLRENVPADLVSIFVLPPSVEELERRLRGRGQDADEVVAKRMAKAGHEMSHWPEYDYVIINSDLDHSIQAVEAILAAERLKRDRQLGLSEFVKSLRKEV